MNLTINRANSTPVGAINLAATNASAPKVEKNDRAEECLRVSSVTGEAEIEISDEVLRRDDDLGKLFDRAFTVACPAMPNFQE